MASTDNKELGDKGLTICYDKAFQEGLSHYEQIMVILEVIKVLRDIEDRFTQEILESKLRWEDLYSKNQKLLHELEQAIETCGASMGDSLRALRVAIELPNTRRKKFVSSQMDYGASFEDFKMRLQEKEGLNICKAIYCHVRDDLKKEFEGSIAKISRGLEETQLIFELEYMKMQNGHINKMLLEELPKQIETNPYLKDAEKEHIQKTLQENLDGVEIEILPRYIPNTDYFGVIEKGDILDVFKTGIPNCPLPKLAAISSDLVTLVTGTGKRAPTALDKPTKEMYNFFSVGGSKKTVVSSMGGYLELPRDNDTYDAETHIQMAKGHIRHGGEYELGEAITALKRAIDSRIEDIFWYMGLHDISQKEAWQMPKKFEIITEIIGLPIKILEDLNITRRELEHRDKKPVDKDRIVWYSDAVQNFLDRTVEFAKGGRLPATITLLKTNADKSASPEELRMLIHRAAITRIPDLEGPKRMSASNKFNVEEMTVEILHEYNAIKIVLETFTVDDAKIQVSEIPLGKIDAYKKALGFWYKAVRSSPAINPWPFNRVGVV